MTAQIFNLDVIANNMANASTTGFKRSRTNFEDLFYQYYKLPGALEVNTGQMTPIGTAIGMGTQVTGTQLDFTQGSFLTTGRPLDLAIVGEGFFQVQDVTAPGSILYTRNGQLTRNANGQIMIASANRGYPLEPSIVIPQEATNINVSADGVVSYLAPGNYTQVQAGIIQLAKFFNNEGLIQYGNSMFLPSDASNVPTPGSPGTLGLGTIQQNTLEASNSEPVKELVELIRTQRNVELNSQVVQATDQLLQLVSNLRRF